MEDIKDLYRKIKVEAIKALAFNIFLNAAIIFLAFNFVLSFFGIPYVVSLIPAIVYFFKSITSHVRKFDIKEFQKRNPALDHIVSDAEKSAKHQHMLSDTVFANLVRKTKTALFFNLISNRRIREKVYVIVVIALLTVLIGSFNLYPTKVTFKVSDIDLTQPSLWGNIFQRIEIQAPEFSSCYDELNHTQTILKEKEEQLLSVSTEFNETEAVLAKTSAKLVTTENKLETCQKNYEEASPYEALYNQERVKYNACSSDLASTSEEKSSCLTEKAAYVQENSQLRIRLDDCFDRVADCTN